MRLKANHIAILFIAAFLVTSFFIVNDYGAILDSQKNYHEGEVNLNYVLSGKIEQRDLRWQMHGAFSFMLADASRRLLCNRLNLMNPISSRHVILPILSAFFMYPLFLFVRRHWGDWQGLMTIACFAMYPAIFGHTFNNLKDVPLLIFFSLSVIFYSEWWQSRKIRYLYGYFIFWGFAISIKTYALLVPVILIPWMLVASFFKGAKNEDGFQINIIFHLLIGLSVTSIIVLLLYAPGFWGIENKVSFMEFWHYRAKGVALGGRGHWNIIPFTQVFFKTPLPMLIFSIAGIAYSVIEYRKATINILLLFWMFIPIIIPCLPSILLYHDGLRLFLVFTVPFSILSVVGLTRLAKILGKYFKISETIFMCLFGVMMIGSNFYGVITTHPYQTTFFNRLADGLEGAQEKGIKDALDYWLNCYKEAGKWLDDHAAKDSKVLVVYQSGTHPKFNTDLMKYSISRQDISITRVPVLPTLHGKPFTLKNTYVVMVPKFYLRSARDLLNSSPEFEIVYQIKRQGGEICTIYYHSGSS